MATQARLGLDLDTGATGGIMDRAVLLALTIRRFGISKKAPISELQTDADKKMLRLSKHLLESKEYDAIVQCDSKLAAALRNLALPSMFKAGIYCIPLALLDKVDSMILQYSEVDRPALVDAFCTVYQEQADSGMDRLRSLGDINNYPPAEYVHTRFGVEYRYVSTSVPEKLRQINAEMFAREAQKAQLEVASMTNEIRDLLRASMRDLLGHAAERLQPGVDGKSKKFHDSLVSNIREFLSTFQARNITDDADLAAICGEVDALMDGLNVEDLRSDASMRGQVQVAFSGYAAALDTMVVDRPSRKLRRV
jgi:hypothetical protein